MDKRKYIQRCMGSQNPDKMSWFITHLLEDRLMAGNADGYQEQLTMWNLQKVHMKNLQCRIFQILYKHTEAKVAVDSACENDDLLARKAELLNNAK